ncbi:MAG: response regulator [bacterium]|nr:response regulator [bacterium]
MVVEDEALIAADIRECLESMGYGVSSVVASGEEAVARAGEERPDLVLMDIVLRDQMTGIEAADRIGADCGIPVVFLSSNTDAEFIERSKAAAPFGYLVKPFEEQELRATIEMALVRHRLEQERERLIGELQEVIREREQAEVELRKLSHAVEQSPTAVIITDLEGAIEYVNPRFTEMTGYGREEVLGRNPSVLRSGKQDPELYRELWETISSGREWRGEFCNRKKNGELYWELASISAIRDPDGELTHYVAVKEEITQRKRDEEELRRSKEAAEAANRAKSVFLANMSHEIRTPMNGIIGMLDLALATELSPDQSEHLRMAKDSAESLLLLLRDILDFSKIEADRLDLESIPFRLRESIADVMRIVAVASGRKELEVRWEAAEGVPDTFLGDPGRLRQILINLLGNAVKFTDRGEVVLRVEPESADAGDVVLHFSVSDTGIGIPAEQLASIFSPFTQVDGTLTRPAGGTGLGLAICQRLVELMGGRIWAESEVGRGSTFHFSARFPRVPVPEKKPTQEAPSGTRLCGTRRSLRILLAEDHPVNQALLSALLRNQGHEVEVVSTGEEALAALAEERPDLVLMDVQMPHMDGLEATARIRQMEEGLDRRLPIIAITAHAMKGDRERFLGAGMDGYVEKPIRTEALFRTIDEVIVHVAGAGSGR